MGETVYLSKPAGQAATNIIRTFKVRSGANYEHDDWRTLEIRRVVEEARSMADALEFLIREDTHNG